MKTLLLFDDPQIKTGFAYTCRLTARQLAARGHALVAAGFNCGDQSERRFEGVPVLPNPRAVESADQNVQLYGDAALYEQWCASVDPDVVFLHNDFHRFAWVCDLPDEEKARLAWWIPLDGPGVSPEYEYSVARVPNVAVTSHHAREVLRRVPDVRVIPHAVDPRAFAAPAPSSEGPFVVLRIDRHQSRKAWSRTLEGFASFARGKDDVLLLAKCDPRDAVGFDPIVGANVDLRELAQRLGVADRVVFEPACLPEKAMEDVWSRGTVFLTTSGSEGFGLSVAEAGARGLPVVAPFHTVFPEVVGDHGWLVPATEHLWDPSMHVPYQLPTADGVAAALEEAYHEWKKTPEKFAKRSGLTRERAATLFHPERVYGLWDEFLRGVARDRRVGWASRKSAAQAAPVAAPVPGGEELLGTVVRAPRWDPSDAAAAGWLPCAEEPGTFKKYHERALQTTPGQPFPLVGVVVATRDRPEVLEKLLESLTEMTPVPGVLGYAVRVVVADSSSAESDLRRARVAVQLARERGLDAVHVANTGPSRSAGQTRDVGYRALDPATPYVLFCDDDVVFLPFCKDGKPWPEATLDCLFRRWPDLASIGATNFPCDTFQERDPERWNVVWFNSACWFFARRDVLDAFGEGPWDPHFSDPPDTWGCEDIDLRVGQLLAGYAVSDLGNFPVYHPGLGVKEGWAERERVVKKTAAWMADKWFPRFTEIRHSVVVVSYESRDLVERLVESVIARGDLGRTESLELVLVDNGSSRETRAWLRTFQTRVAERVGPRFLRVLFTRGRVGFGTACDVGLQRALGDYVTFLNNDCVVTDALWLENTRRRLDAPGVHVVGPDPCEYYCPWARRDLPRALARHATECGLDATFGFVGGWFLTARTSDARELGGFDEGITGYYFEDVDLCLRARDRWGEGCVVGVSLAELGVAHLNQESAKRFWTPEEARRFHERSFAEAVARWSQRSIVPVAVPPRLVPDDGDKLGPSIPASRATDVGEDDDWLRSLPSVSLWPRGGPVAVDERPSWTNVSVTRETAEKQQNKWRGAPGTTALDRRIEVETCTRDRREALCQLLVSLLSQSFTEWDLIVVDDGETALSASEDSPTGQLLRTIEAEGHRVRVFEGPRSGPHASHQVALDHALCERVFRVDDDEVLGTDCLAELARATDDGRVVAAAPLLLFPGSREEGDGEAPEVGPDDWMAAAYVQQRRWPRAERRRAPAAHLHSCFVYRTEAARAVGGYPRGLSPVGFGEETLFTRALAEVGPLEVCLDAVAWHLQRPSGGTRYDGSDYHRWVERDKLEFPRLLGEAVARGERASRTVVFGPATVLTENSAPVAETLQRPPPGSFEPWSVPLARDLVPSVRETPSDSRDVTSYADVMGWSDFEDAYATAARDLSGRDGAVFVEVGTFLGRSACLMGQLLRQRNSRARLVAYDAMDPTLLGDGDEARLTADLYASVGGPDAAWAELQKNVAALGLGRWVETRRESSLAAAKRHSDGSLDFVFIDAAHDSASVSADLAAWWPKVRVGGVLAGHDWEHFLVGDSVKRAVNGFFGTSGDELLIRPKSWGARKLSVEKD